MINSMHETNTLSQSSFKRASVRKRVRGFNQGLVEEALRRVPTGGNAKPFVWQWQERNLTVRIGRKRAAHYLNRNNHASLLALGCLIEAVEQAALFQGCEIEFEIDKKTLETKIQFLPSVSLHRCAGAAENYEAVLKRRTYRGRFVDSPMPMLEHESNVKMCGAISITDDLKRYLTKSQMYIWRQRRATRDFLKEVNFFSSKSPTDARGIRSGDLGVPKIDEVLLYLLRPVSWVLRAMSRVSILNFPFVQSTTRTIENAHFVLITSEGRDADGLIQAGRRAMKTWLRLEQIGYSVQPLSTASLTLVDAAKGVLPADTHPEFRRLFSIEGPTVLRREFDLDWNEHPVWLLRVGRAA